MLRRKPAKNGKKVKVTFVLPGDHPHPNASVVGDFNDWDENAHPFRKRSNGTYSTAVELDRGERHVFRYVTEEGHWFNEPSADAYEPNDFGGENCVLIT